MLNDLKFFVYGTPEQVQQFGGELLQDGCWTSI